MIELTYLISLCDHHGTRKRTGYAYLAGRHQVCLYCLNDKWGFDHYQTGFSLGGLDTSAGKGLASQLDALARKLDAIAGKLDEREDPWPPTINAPEDFPIQAPENFPIQGGKG